MLRIACLEVPQYRQLVGVEALRLGKPTVVVGPNGIGKSTLVRALVFLLSGSLDEQDRVVGELEVRGVFEDADGQEVRLRRVLGQDGVVRLERWAHVPEDEHLRGLGAMHADELRERLATYLPGYSGDKRAKARMVEALEAHAGTLSHVGDWAAADKSLDDLLPLDILFASTEEPDPEEEVRRSLNGTFKAFQSADTFRERLQELEREANEHLQDAGRSIRETLKARCADLGEPQLTAEVAIANTFRGVALTVGPEDARRPLGALGAGERRRITLAVWEATAAAFQAMDVDAEGPVRQRVVIYDEPDTHLDYFRQRELMSLILDQASRPNDCVVVTTHSQNLVDGVDPDSIVALRKAGPSTSTAEVFLGGDIDDHISEIATSLGIGNSALLNERCFIVVEGPTEAAAFPVLYRHCRGRRHQADGIVFLSVHGNAGALKVASLLKRLGRRVVVLVDRDCVTHEATKKIFGEEALERHGLQDDLMLLGGEQQTDVEEFEGLFGDDQWAAALNVASPRADRLWMPSDIASLRSTKKFSSELARLVHEVSGQGASKPGMALAVSDQSTREAAVPEQIAAAFEEIARRLR